MRFIRTHADKGIRFFGTGGEQAARPVVFEGAAEEMLAVGDQGGGEGVAFVAGIVPAVEGERERSVAVDAAALREAKRGHCDCPIL